MYGLSPPYSLTMEQCWTVPARPYLHGRPALDRSFQNWIYLHLDNGTTSNIDDVLIENCGLLYVLPLAVYLKNICWRTSIEGTILKLSYSLGPGFIAVTSLIAAMCRPWQWATADEARVRTVLLSAVTAGKAETVARRLNPGMPSLLQWVKWCKINKHFIYLTYSKELWWIVF